MDSFKKTKIRAYLLFPLVFWTLYSWSQTDKPVFVFEGIVYGYHYDPSKKLLKKTKPFVLEGLLNGVDINLYQRDKLIYNGKTNKNGEINLAIPLNGVFKLELSKAGYEKNILLIDTRFIPKKRASMGIGFIGAEFMLNSFIIKEETDPEPIGKLNYDKVKNRFELVVNFKRSTKTANSEDLIRKAILKNNSPSSSPSVTSKTNPSILNKDSVVTTNKKFTKEFSVTPSGIENITAEDIPFLKDEIAKSRAELADDKRNAISREDSLLIDAKEAVIQAAEIELQNALTLIAAQKSEIRYQKRALYAILVGLLLLTGSSIVLYIYYRDKKRTNRLLENQNRNILDSINYAKRIQQSILVEEQEIRKVLPHFFIYYQAKDIVSGDFYWFSNIDDKLIIAVIDCTGHGVPGAFMSLIANTLLNEIVNEKRITDPAFILQHLHKGVTEALHQEKDNNWSYDGMDMGLCVINKTRNKIEYAGAMHPLYVVHNNAVDVIKADMHSIGGRKLKASRGNVREFTNHTIQIKKEMSFYMFSDGYVDQFGEEKRKKFSTERFKRLLLEIQSQDMDTQKELVKKAIDEWRGSFKQIDDMLVLGMKI